MVKANSAGATKDTMCSLNDLVEAFKGKPDILKRVEAMKRSVTKSVLLLHNTLPKPEPAYPTDGNSEYYSFLLTQVEAQIILLGSFLRNVPYNFELIAFSLENVPSSRNDSQFEAFEERFHAWRSSPQTFLLTKGIMSGNQADNCGTITKSNPPSRTVDDDKGENAVEALGSEGLGVQILETGPSNLPNQRDNQQYQASSVISTNPRGSEAGPLFPTKSADSLRSKELERELLLPLINARLNKKSKEPSSSPPLDFLSELELPLDSEAVRVSRLASAKSLLRSCFSNDVHFECQLESCEWPKMAQKIVSDSLLSLSTAKRVIQSVSEEVRRLQQEPLGQQLAAVSMPGTDAAAVWSACTVAQACLAGAQAACHIVQQSGQSASVTATAEECLPAAEKRRTKDTGSSSSSRGNAVDSALPAVSAGDPLRLQHSFRIGDLVEVMSNERGLKGAWFSGTILQMSTVKALVVYRDLLDDDEASCLKEWVHLHPPDTENGVTTRDFFCKSRVLRPGRPTGTEQQRRQRVSSREFRPWVEREHAEVWSSDGWWEGVVTHVAGEGEDATAVVFFPLENDVETVKIWNLRPLLLWMEPDRSHGDASEGAWVEWRGGQQCPPVREYPRPATSAEALSSSPVPVQRKQPEKQRKGAQEERVASAEKKCVDAMSSRKRRFVWQ